MNTKKAQLLASNPQLIASISIITTAIIVSVSMLAVSGGLSELYSKARRALPKFVGFKSMKEITDYSTIASVVEGQPRISFNSDSKYLLVEANDIDCLTCARFHGFGIEGESSYSKLFRDYVESGKMDYMWIDNYSSGDVKKHNSTYCIAEQNPKKFFEYINLLYAKYGAVFDDETAARYAGNVNADTKKFNECLTSNRYSGRVTSLTSFTKSTLAAPYTSNLFVYRINNAETRNLDGTVSKDKSFTLVKTLNATSDYETLIKPELDTLFK